MPFVTKYESVNQSDVSRNGNGRVNVKVTCDYSNQLLNQLQFQCLLANPKVCKQNPWMVIFQPIECLMWPIIVTNWPKMAYGPMNIVTNLTIGCFNRLLTSTFIPTCQSNFIEMLPHTVSECQHHSSKIHHLLNLTFPQMSKRRQSDSIYSFTFTHFTTFLMWKDFFINKVEWSARR